MRQTLILAALLLSVQGFDHLDLSEAQDPDLIPHGSCHCDGVHADQVENFEVEDKFDLAGDHEEISNEEW